MPSFYNLSNIEKDYLFFSTYLYLNLTVLNNTKEYYYIREVRHPLLFLSMTLHRQGKL